MQRYINSVANANGTPVSGASVLVQTYPAGTTATIYASNSTAIPVANPVTTDSNGQFAFYAPDGRYQLVISGNAITTQTIKDILLEDTSDGGSLGVFSSITVGTPVISDVEVVAQWTQSYNGYVQQILQNTNNGNAASADYIVSNNLGTANTYYGDFGINSSTFLGSGSFNLPNATYLYSQNGDLVLGTQSLNGVHIVVNNGTTDAISVSASGVSTIQPGVATPAGGSSAAVLLFGTTAGFGIYYGSGAPTISAAAGSLYIRTDNAGASLRLYSNTTGSTVWAAITSA